MTSSYAKLQAVKRWGKHAAIEHRPHHTDPNQQFIVGRIGLGIFFEILGSGNTWEAAFRQADERCAKYGL